MLKLSNLIHGFFMGAAEILPGISGSTCALIMGIYDEFINLLYQISLTLRYFVKFLFRKNDFKLVKGNFGKINFKFAIPLFLGMILAIASLSHFLIYVLEKHPNYIYGFFFGLGIFSITIPYKEMKEKNFKNFVIIIISFLIAFTVFGFKADKIESAPSYPLLFISGIVGITGTVLPGASGSYLLIITGIYDYIVNTVKELTSLNISLDAILNLTVFALGLLLGFVILVRIIKYALTHFPNKLMALIIGVMLGATRVTYPFVSSVESSNRDYYSPIDNVNEYNLIYVWLSIFAAVVLIFLMNKYSDRRQFRKINGK
jgi:putative membrane protein